VDDVTIDPNNGFNTTLNLHPGPGSLPPAKHRIFLGDKTIDGVFKKRDNKDVVVFELGRITPGDYSFTWQINFGSGGGYSALGCSSGNNPNHILRVPDVRQGGTTKAIGGNIEITPSNPTNTDNIHIIAKNLTKDSTYAISLTNQNASLYAEDKYKLSCVKSANKQLDADIGIFTDGTWDVYVSQLNSDACNTSKSNIATNIGNGEFTISAPIIGPTPTPLPVPLPPCARWADLNGKPFPTDATNKQILPPEPTPKKCIAVNTALLEISTEPFGFVKSIMGIVLGVAGGIAVILIIAAGFSLMTSQGNHEVIQDARARIIAAIAGLLFIIFSVAILEIIGVDILHIPGFGK